jgi:thiamine-phosphate pyrophosphorylase
MRLHCIVEDLETARIAVDGATVIQLRRKHVPTPQLVELARPIRDLCRERGITFVVNDDVEAAIVLGADGVHLGRDDDGREEARAAGVVLGLSAASVEEAFEADAGGATYVGAGPVWETPTKLDADPAIGLEGLRAICDSVRVPVVAIGGIDASNAAECIRAGAAGVAVVRASVDARSVRAAVDAAL